jgi:Fe2+ or Zn2+ uptake regulation protein
MSRTTVYRVLETLVRIGVIAKVCHPGAAVRFDPKIRQHHHLVCLHCNRVVDLEDKRLNEITLPEISTRGFEVQECHFHFRGVCPACQKKSAQSRKGTGRAARASKSKPAEGKEKAGSKTKRV